MLTDRHSCRTYSRVKLSPFLTWPILTAPRFGFTNTSSAIKHNDSVGRGGGVTAPHLPLYPSLFPPTPPPKKHLQAIHVSTNLSLHVTLLSLCPCQLLSNLCTHNRKKLTMGRDMCLRCTNVHVKRDRGGR